MVPGEKARQQAGSLLFLFCPACLPSLLLPPAAAPSLALSCADLLRVCFVVAFTPGHCVRTMMVGDADAAAAAAAVGPPAASEALPPAPAPVFSDHGQHVTALAEVFDCLGFRRSRDMDSVVNLKKVGRTAIATSIAAVPRRSPRPVATVSLKIIGTLHVIFSGR